MTTEEKFRSAVNIIRGLPKKGSFSPPVELQLKFYGYFKQATEGSNTASKPYLWEVEKRFKWDAWSRLGDMSKEDAMNLYVRELNNIVESMAASVNVNDALAGMDEFYARVAAEDVDLCIGPTIAKIRAKANSSIPSYPAPSKENLRISIGSKLDEDDEHFLDSLDTLAITDGSITPDSESDKLVYANGHLSSSKNDLIRENTVDILTKTVVTLRTDLTGIAERINKVELIQKSLSKSRKQLFSNLSLQTIAFITLWPICVNLGLIYLYSRRKRSH